MKAMPKLLRLVVVCCSLAFSLTVAAQEQAYQTAPVEVDGEVLFRVRGMEALPATVRADTIARNIKTLASDRSFSTDTLHAQDRGIVTDIVGGRIVVMGIVDEDGELEGVDRSILVPVYVLRIRQAITEYREARSRHSLIAGSGRAVAAITLSALFVLLLAWLLRRAETRLKTVFDRHVSTLATQTRRVRRVARLWKTVHSALGVVRIVIVLLVALFLLEYVLRQFPWTRGAGIGLFQAISSPLASIGHSFLANIPNLVLLVILFFLIRYGHSAVVNYSKPAREGKLVMHSEVNIGYGVPWRQVEALLLEAANRTPNLLKEPPPYVIQLKLGEFAVTYQINGFTDRADMMQWIYTDLHRNILDQFNEHGVQIMTPAYEGDPESPKIVAKDQWFTSPATGNE